MAIEIVLPVWEAGRWIAGFMLIIFGTISGIITCWAIQERSWAALILGAMTALFIIALLTTWKFLVWTFV